MIRTLRIPAAAAAAALALASPLAARAAAAPVVPAADVQFDQGSIHVSRFGHGDAVVLLPGLTTGPWEWADVIRHLAQRHTVYAVALPGFDGRPSAAAPLFARVTGDIWAFLDVQKVSRPALIGHSLGGTLAILLGEQHPERLRGIVAIEGMPIFPGNERVTSDQRTSMANTVFAQVAGETHDQLLAYEKQYMHGAGGVLDPSLGDQLAELEARSDPAATAQWLKEDLSADLRPDLPKISVPLLEIAPYNAPDLAASPVHYTEEQKTQYYGALLTGAPRVQVVSVSPARHFAMFDQPDKVDALIDAFLDRTT